MPPSKKGKSAVGNASASPKGKALSRAPSRASVNVSGSPTAKASTPQKRKADDESDAQSKIVVRPRLGDVHCCFVCQGTSKDVSTLYKQGITPCAKHHAPIILY